MSGLDVTRILVVSCAVVLASASASSRRQTAGRPIQSISLAAIQEVDGVVVYVAVEEGEVWRILVQNDTDDLLTIVWDESSIIGPGRESWGRPIQAGGSRISAAAPHPASPLAPHSRVAETVIPEKFTQVPWGQTAATGTRLVLSLRRGDERLTAQYEIR